MTGSEWSPVDDALRHLDTAAKEEGTGFSLIHPDRVMDVLRFAVMSGAYAGLTDAGGARDAAAARAAKIAWSAPGEKLALLAMSPLTGRAP